MSPYILLSDRSRSSSITITGQNSQFPSLKSPTNQKSSSAALDEFLSYADQLSKHSTSDSGALVSPTASQPPRRRSSFEDPTPNNMKEAIDLAILRSNLTSGSTDQPVQSNNRFTIARGGQLVAVITIVRPANRLGETISGIGDFGPSLTENDPAAEQIKSYGVNVWLETTERVDPSLALRSSSSVQRATRKTYAHASETVLFARRVSFRLEIPTTATPTFETTGVQLAWRVRVEFVTARVRPKIARGLGIDEAEGEEEEEPMQATTETEGDLLEEVGRDERGVVKIAKERLIAENFEVSVPVRVYGVAGTGAEGIEAATEGLEF